MARAGGGGSGRGRPAGLLLREKTPVLPAPGGADFRLCHGRAHTSGSQRQPGRRLFAGGPAEGSAGDAGGRAHNADE